MMASDCAAILDSGLLGVGSWDLQGGVGEEEGKIIKLVIQIDKCSYLLFT